MHSNNDYYLVFLNAIPVAMFSEERLALEFAKNVEPEYQLHAVAAFDIDEDTLPMAVFIIRFNMGIPVSRERVRLIDSE